MRLDGWKAIAKHLGRERTTVMRWAADRGMPVHRVPGARRGSVFALSEELDQWLGADGQLETAAKASAPQPAMASGGPISPAPPKGRSRWQSGWHKAWLGGRFSGWLRGWLAVPLALGGLSLVAWAWPESAEQAPSAALPANADAAALYLEARGDWAERSPASIERAIGKLNRVVAAEPGFAPAYAALADCYVLSREFGARGDAEAFARAQQAVAAALRIDPENVAALRADGFIAYWWRRDRAAAQASFARALARGPNVAQTHFWYGNVLVDNGDFAAGIAHLDQARLLEPALVALQVDLAWARWSAGDEAQGKAQLLALAEAHPQLATIHDYLAAMALAEGDAAGFVRATGDLARTAADPVAQAQADRLAAALAQGEAQMVRLLLEQTMAEAASGDRTELVWPAYIAGMLGDAAALRRLLAMAEQRKESWGSAGMVRVLAARWQGDARMAAMIDARRPPSMVAQ